MNDRELLRYNRHILLPQIDIEGQEKICAARCLIIGLGGLGSPAAMYLAASGVGELILVDDDHVDESNLQRQIVHNENRLQVNKAESARQQLLALNSMIQVQTFARRLDDSELREHIKSADVVLDCSDNFSTRKQVNRLCVDESVPLVSGAAVRFEGQLTVIDKREQTNPCYQCLYEDVGEENLSCSQNGVLAPVVGIVGTSQALEALKIICELNDVLTGVLALFDGKANRWRYLNFNKNKNCKVCA